MFLFVEKLSTIFFVWKNNINVIDKNFATCLKVTTFPKYATPLPGNNGSKGE
jgi:hypothetical protein